MEQKERRRLEALLQKVGEDCDVLMMETERAPWASEIAERHLELAAFVQGYLDGLEWAETGDNERLK